jgi:glycosyltransferase involved in cell wall biosynthesis
MFAASSETKAFLVRLLKEHTYDLIWVSGWDMIVNLPKRPDVPLLADAVDDGVLEYWREVRAARTLYQFLRMLKWLLMNYLFERRYFGPADRCLFVSEVDAAFFNRVCRSTRVSAVHNGVDVDYYRPCETARRPFNMVFEGNMSFRPNTDGILYFCRAVLPLIRAHIPEASLTLVGKNPTAEILSLRTEGIEVTGFVEDVRPYLDRAGVFICPLRIGAGIKNKILQAWAMAKPVVATPASVGGLLWREGENILVRNSASEFADATVEILRSPKRSEAIGNAARATILNHYTWDKKARELETIMLEISGDQLGHHSGAMSYNNTSR